MRALSQDHISILIHMRHIADHWIEPWTTAQWVAEALGHAYDTPWASSRIQTLTKRGFVERGIRGYYRITDAGRGALVEVEREPA